MADLFQTVITGTANDDSLSGTAGNDRMAGLAGNDTIDGGEGFDVVDYSGDAAAGGPAAVNVVLGNTGTAQDGFGNTDTLTGIEGIIGTAGNDFMEGGLVMWPGLSDWFAGLAGGDVIIGNELVVRPPNSFPFFLNPLSVASYHLDHEYGGTQGIVANLTTGRIQDGFGDPDTVHSVEAVWGTPYDDAFLASTPQFNADVSGIPAFMLEVDNYFWGGAGNDAFYGAGELPADHPFGVMEVYAAGNEYLDEVIVTYELDTVFPSASGQAGSSGVTADLLAGTATDAYGGNDRFYGTITGLVGSHLDDVLRGDHGNNTLVGLGGNDILDGRYGIDTVDYDYDAYSPLSYVDRDTTLASLSGVTVNLGAGTATDPRGGTDTLISIENVNGTPLSDLIIGNAKNNEIEGGDGDDYIYGRAGNDWIEGGNGNNKIKGGAGDDSISVGDGQSLIFGEDGQDEIRIYTLDSTSQIYAHGGTGDDWISVWGEGQHRLRGGDGNDYLEGGNGADILKGDAGNDALFGGSGYDVLYGGDGDDRLEAGNDGGVLYGGAGADIFAYSPVAGSGSVYIRDFTPGEDKLQIGAEITPAQVLSFAVQTSWGVKIDFRDPTVPETANNVIYIYGVELGTTFTEADIVNILLPV